MDLRNSIYGYLHERGEIVHKEDKQKQYKVGNKKTCTLDKGCHMLLFQRHVNGWILIQMDIHFITPLSLIHLHFKSWMMIMHMMLSHSYDYAHIYVLKRTRRVEGEEGIVNVQNDYW